MEFLLACAAVAVGLFFARRGFLHPGDYLVAAALAVLWAAAVFAVLPDGQQTHLLASIGAPHTAFVRSEFLMAHGAKIVVASILVALGSCLGAEVRRRVTPEQYV